MWKIVYRYCIMDVVTVLHSFQQVVVATTRLFLSLSKTTHMSEILQQRHMQWTLVMTIINTANVPMY